MVKSCRMKLKLNILLIICLMNHSLAQEDETIGNKDANNSSGTETTTTVTTLNVTPIAITVDVATPINLTPPHGITNANEPNKGLKKCCASQQIYNFKEGVCIDVSEDPNLNLFFATLNGTDVILDIETTEIVENQKCKGEVNTVVTHGSMSGYLEKYDLMSTSNYSLIVYNQYSDKYNIFDEYCVDFDSETDLIKAVLCDTIKTCAETGSESFVKDKKFVANECYGIPLEFDFSMLSNGFYRRSYERWGKNYSDLYEDYCIEKEESGKYIVNLCNAIKKFCPNHMWLSSAEDGELACSNKTKDLGNEALKVEFQEYKNNLAIKINRSISELNFLPVDDNFDDKAWGPLKSIIKDNKDSPIVEYFYDESIWLYGDTPNPDSFLQIYAIMSVEIILLIIQILFAAFYIICPSNNDDSKASGIRVACFIILWALATLTDNGIWCLKSETRTVRIMNKIFNLSSFIYLLELMCYLFKSTRDQSRNPVNDAPDIPDVEEVGTFRNNVFIKELMYTLLAILVAILIAVIGYFVGAKVEQDWFQYDDFILFLQFVVISLAYTLYRCYSKQIDETKNEDLKTKTVRLVECELLFIIIDILIQFLHKHASMLKSLIIILEGLILLAVLLPKNGLKRLIDWIQVKIRKESNVEQVVDMSEDLENIQMEENLSKEATTGKLSTDDSAKNSDTNLTDGKPSTEDQLVNPDKENVVSEIIGDNEIQCIEDEATTENLSSPEKCNLEIDENDNKAITSEEHLTSSTTNEDEKEN